MDHTHTHTRTQAQEAVGGSFLLEGGHLALEVGLADGGLLGLDLIGGLLLLDLVLELLGAVQVVGLGLEEVLGATDTLLLHVDGGLGDELEALEGELIPGSLPEDQEELPERDDI